MQVSCPNCEVSLTRDELDSHCKECPHAKRACQAAAYGCKVKLEIPEIEEHEKSCTLVMLGPYLEGQSSRMASMDSTIRQLQQRNAVLEEGIASIRSALTQRTLGTSSDTNSETQTPTRTNTIPIPAEASNEISRVEQETSTNTPSSSTTTYLLAIHESLREEVACLSSALNDVDARTNMSIMNENLRLREDMAHINAAINTIRMQVHMLMNMRFHQGQRAEPASGGQPPNGENAISVTNNAAGLSRLGGSVPEVLRGRRLSDSSREGTKL